MKYLGPEDVTPFHLLLVFEMVSKYENSLQNAFRLMQAT